MKDKNFLNHIINNNVKAITDLFKNDKTQMNLYKKKCISESCRNGAIDVVKLYLEAEHFNAHDWVNSITFAANHFYVVELLLNEDKIKPRCLNNALYFACEKGNFEVVELLLKEKNLVREDFNNRAIVKAIEKKYSNIVKILLEEEAIKNTLKKDNPNAYNLLLSQKINKF